jgi:hypothetical protein
VKPSSRCSEDGREHGYTLDSIHKRRCAWNHVIWFATKDSLDDGGFPKRASPLDIEIILPSMTGEHIAPTNEVCKFIGIPHRHQANAGAEIWQIQCYSNQWC